MAYIDPSLPFKDLIDSQRRIYKRFVSVDCYILHKKVKFTAQGFEHLHMDGRKKRRGEKDARSRLMLMEHAPSVITQARFMKKDAKSAKATYSRKPEVYYELYSKIGMKQINVIMTLRIVGDGDLHFYGIRYRRYKKKSATEAADS